MEAKIDVRKLQLLSDRIQQTIDALNQVRTSVSGLSHSNVPQPQYGVPMGTASAFPPPQIAPWGAPLQHSAPSMQAVALQQPTPQLGLQAVAPQPIFAQVPAVMGLVGGIAHSSASDLAEQRNAELRASDPTRLSQTFPYLFAQYAPIPVM